MVAQANGTGLGAGVEVLIPYGPAYDLTVTVAKSDQYLARAKGAPQAMFAVDAGSPNKRIAAEVSDLSPGGGAAAVVPTEGEGATSASNSLGPDTKPGVASPSQHGGSQPGAAVAAQHGKQAPKSGTAEAPAGDSTEPAEKKIKPRQSCSDSQNLFPSCCAPKTRLSKIFM